MIMILIKKILFGNHHMKILKSNKVFISALLVEKLNYQNFFMLDTQVNVKNVEKLIIKIIKIQEKFIT